MTETRKPSLLEALIPMLFLIGLLIYNVAFVFGDDALSGSNQIILLMTAGVAGLIAVFRLNYSWKELRSGIVDSISSAMASILILLLIGALAGTWLISGVVPAMIYYGLELLSPSIFLVAAVLISSIVSVATGSSWSTIATVGIALLGIGTALGMNQGLVAGAIISGAYFGDKMSPLSDTTNLAPAMAGTDLFTHIRYMAYTTAPSYILTLIIFVFIGFFYDAQAIGGDVAQVQQIIDNTFNINLALFIVPAVVIWLIVKKTPALPALAVGILLAGAFAVLFQPEVVQNVSGWEEGAIENIYVGVMKSMYGDISIVTQNAQVNKLLSTGGMFGMLNTIWLIICAMIFGGIMEKSGMLATITESIIQLAHSTGSLIATTVGTCIVFNVTASDQYLAIVVPGRMFADTYRNRGLAPENLSRTLEDSGTVTSVLIPWNTCGATQAGVLKVSTFDFAPYCFFNIISPFMSIIFGYFNIKIRKLEEGETKDTVKATEA